MLSAFLIVKNEAVDLPDCLQSLRGLADEIVIVDSGSTDATAEIAHAVGVRWFHRAFDGYSAQKQFALDQCRGDWALSIDADERVSAPLAAEIRQTIALPSALAGYRLRRHLYFLGRRLRFGGVGTDWPLRLFRRSRGRYSGTQVHERIDVSGNVGTLNAPLLHFSYASIAEYHEKSRAYAALGAEDLHARGRRFGLLDWARPAWELINRIALRGAWLDGWPGLAYAALSAQSAWRRSAALRRLQESRP